MAIRNFNHRLGEAQRAAAIQMLFGNNNAIVATALSKLTLDWHFQQLLKAMAANGSPAPQFETDDDRLTCVVRLPVHPLAEMPVTEQVTPEVTQQVTQQVMPLLQVLAGEMSRSDLMMAMVLRDRVNFSSLYLTPALEAGLIEMTLPDKPRSSKQRYRLTLLGERCLQAQRERERE